MKKKNLTLNTTPEMMLLLPASVRDGIINFFQLPDVIAPSREVIQIVATLNTLEKVETGAEVGTVEPSGSA